MKLDLTSLGLSVLFFMLSLLGNATYRAGINYTALGIARAGISSSYFIPLFRSAFLLAYLGLYAHYICSLHGNQPSTDIRRGLLITHRHYGRGHYHFHTIIPLWQQR